jgi:hypothetical protein
MPSARNWSRSALTYTVFHTTPAFVTNVRAGACVFTGDCRRMPQRVVAGARHTGQAALLLNPLPGLFRAEVPMFSVT